MPAWLEDGHGYDEPGEIFVCINPEVGGTVTEWGGAPAERHEGGGDPLDLLSPFRLSTLHRSYHRAGPAGRSSGSLSPPIRGVPADAGILYWMARPDDLASGDLSGISFSWQRG